jgi:hypothetical protein
MTGTPGDLPGTPDVLDLLTEALESLTVPPVGAVRLDNREPLSSRLFNIDE